MGVDIDEKEMEMVVLNGFATKFEWFILALDGLGNEEKMLSMEFLKSRLLQE